jgi:diadenylate cyclase
LGLFLFSSGKQTFGYLTQIIKAVEELSAKKTGALIVLERSTGLTEYVGTGHKLEALVSQNLLISIFEKNAPLHDGAVIISGDRIQAAGCVLPLSESELDDRLSTRHRAGLGISEVSDAFVIIVSEETGIISLAENGFLSRYLDRESLEERLLGSYRKETEMRFANFFKQAGDWLKK